MYKFCFLAWHLEIMRYSYSSNKENENLNFDESSINEEENIQASQYDTSDVLTIEGLRRQYNSCSE